ncbi:thiol reductant ABC exporter subunit CydD [Cellulomonas marina]|uniref:ATP-binding cassette, subfamily C, CydD n=1 Tax=Cellulomonas marina TaxID=988821 RepID=A0A1I0YSY0_9CELL|nr:thiol reductant ABC exporter subunit CydD [Cellulomonas marina]GIG27592.1 thiol reductant ABC exporter subunit CydD [Cellulomonas marina]SFB15213.1 ATP-binding cassette, subfamily C, CydD [Cellulomonas marina]
MKPLDPRLLRHARAARAYLALTVATGVLTAGLVVAQALLLARALGGAVQDGLDLAAVGDEVVALAAVVLARVLVVGVQERFAHRAATRAVAELRAGVVERAVALGPRWLAAGRGPELVTLATRGLDALEPYFVRYLPQLVLAATVTPAALLVVLGLDRVSAAVVVGTLPLVPVFMVLVGRLTEGRSARGLRGMQTLAAQTLDLLAGLPTLRALGRERGPAARVRELGDAHRRATMGTLRIAFLSGMVLELLTTLSVALVAVGIGLRLVGGHLPLVTGLAVLVLAPEVYAPLRQVGAQFHASTDGVAAAEAAFAVLETPLPPRGTHPAPDLARTALRLHGVAVRQPTGALAPEGLDLEVRPGRVVALVGTSGSGKTTAVEVLLGLLRPDAGAARLVAVDGTGPALDLADVDPATLWSQVSWLPQRPVLEPGTVAALVGGDAPVRERAAALTGLDAVVAALPDGWGHRVGAGGTGLSVGQRQRVALTRALVSPAPLVVLDEPTAHLDAHGEEVVLRTVETLRASGRAVVLVAHRASLAAVADDVVVVRAAAATEMEADRPAAPAPAGTPRAATVAAGRSDAPVPEVVR